MKNLIILAPNDRYNYGDLIFSHIIKWQLRNCYDRFINVATVDNDLTSVGGDKVYGISFLYNLNKKNEKYDLIVAGGESLFSDWASCLSYLSGKYKFLPYLSRILRKIFSNENASYLENKLGAFIFNSNTRYPYTVGKNELPFINKLFFNSVGGNSLSKNMISDSDIKILRTANYISVRDKNSYNILRKKNIGCKLCPDSAILMSCLFPIIDLDKLVSKETKQFIALNHEYIVFQVNKFIGNTYINDICNLLQLVHKKFNYKILLCPIGYALGHEDPIALSNIEQTINSDYIINPKHIIKIWDIMYFICSSKLFIGSSLHGVITAMSYNIPYIGIKVEKTIAYITTWGIQNHSFSYDFDIIDKIEYHLKNPNNKDLMDNYSRQKTLSLCSFNLIKEMSR